MPCIVDALLYTAVFSTEMRLTPFGIVAANKALAALPLIGSFRGKCRLAYLG